MTLWDHCDRGFMVSAEAEELTRFRKLWETLSYELGDVAANEALGLLSRMPTEEQRTELSEAVLSLLSVLEMGDGPTRYGAAVRPLLHAALSGAQEGGHERQEQEHAEHNGSPRHPR